MTSDVPVLGLSGLFVMVSIKVFPAWFNKHRSGDLAIRVFSVLALAATIAATAWLTWEVASLGVQHSPSHARAPLYGTVLGIPVVMIPLAILLAVVGVAELRVEGVPTPSFGFGKRKDAAVLDSIRGQISGAAMTSRNDLANAIAKIESSVSARIDERARLQSSTGDAIETLQTAVTANAAEVNGTFERVEQMCATVAARIEAHRLEPDPLAEVITRLTAASVTARPEPHAPSDDIVISLVEAEADEAQQVGHTVDVAEPLESRDADDACVADENEAPVLAAVAAAPASVPAAPEVPRYTDRRSGPALTAVERLRKRAQRVGREVWARGKPQTSR